MAKKTVKFTLKEIFYFSPCVANDKIPDKGANALGMKFQHFRSILYDFDKRSIIHVENIKNEEDDVENEVISTPVQNDDIYKKYRNEEQPSEDDEDAQSDGSNHSNKSIDVTPRSSLQPLKPGQRKKYLLNAGVKLEKNDPEFLQEKDALRKIRSARSMVGCKCVGGKCDVLKCSCSVEGIPCQNDGTNFPCKCGSRCSNIEGKRRYNQYRVKHHYAHTLNPTNKNAESKSYEINTDGTCKICSELSDSDLSRMYSPEKLPSNRSRKRNVPKNPTVPETTPTYQDLSPHLSAKPTISPNKKLNLSSANKTAPRSTMNSSNSTNSRNLISNRAYDDSSLKSYHLHLDLTPFSNSDNSANRNLQNKDENKLQFFRRYSSMNNMYQENTPPIIETPMNSPITSVDENSDMLMAASLVCNQAGGNLIRNSPLKRLSLEEVTPVPVCTDATNYSLRPRLVRTMYNEDIFENVASTPRTDNSKKRQRRKSQKLRALKVNGSCPIKEVKKKPKIQKNKAIRSFMNVDIVPFAETSNSAQGKHVLHVINDNQLINTNNNNDNLNNEFECMRHKSINNHNENDNLIFKIFNTEKDSNYNAEDIFTDFGSNNNNLSDLNYDKMDTMLPTSDITMNEDTSMKSVEPVGQCTISTNNIITDQADICTNYTVNYTNDEVVQCSSTQDSIDNKINNQTYSSPEQTNQMIDLTDYFAEPPQQPPADDNSNQSDEFHNEFAFPDYFFEN